jgi:predicted Ser/Thr protein kinase
MQTKFVQYYDDETMDLVGQKYFIGDEEVSFEDYLDVSGDTVEVIEDDCNCDGDCDNCEYENETIDEIIDDYVELIQDTYGCENCIKQLLENFFDEIVDVIEDEEE